MYNLLRLFRILKLFYTYYYYVFFIKCSFEAIIFYNIWKLYSYYNYTGNSKNLQQNSQPNVTEIQMFKAYNKITCI